MCCCFLVTASGNGITSELQKAFNFPSGKIFKVCMNLSQDVVKLSFSMKLYHQFPQTEGMTTGIDQHLLIFFVLFVLG